MHYRPPSTSDLRHLKDELGLTGVEMARLFGLAGGQQWRKYTGGQAPRAMGLHMLFFAAARLELGPEALQRILERMQAAGAEVLLGEVPAARTIAETALPSASAAVPAEASAPPVRTPWAPAAEAGSQTASA